MHSNPSSLAAQTLEFKDLSFAYGKQLVFSKLQFSISKGNLGLITGKNGSGKTTLLKVLATLLRPTEGTAQVFGLDLNRDAQKIRTQLSAGFINTRGLFSHLTVNENLQLHGKLFGLSNVEIQNQISKLQDLLLDKGEMYPAELSMGMRQTVQIAKVFLRPASCYFLDEPFLSLDQTHRHAVEAHCLRVAKEQCLLLSLQESELQNTKLKGQVLCLA